MEILFKYVSASLAALIATLCPVAPLVVAALLFVAVDFLTGVAASRAVARREGRSWWFESRQAWRTVAKAGFVAMAIVMMWIVDHHVLGFMHLNLANLFTGFVCGVELWSFLENAATISRAPLFRWLGRWVKRRVGKEVDGE
ncbi:MAG: phage holin family protein [Alistipes sp.]|nr:phage holin family protein [Alistipes sp.]